MKPECNDKFGTPIKPGDWCKAIDDSGKIHTVKITGYTSEPENHDDGKKVYASVDVEKEEGGLLWRGIIGTKRLEKI